MVLGTGAERVSSEGMAASVASIAPSSLALSEFSFIFVSENLNLPELTK